MSDIMNQRYLVSYKLNNDTGLYDLTMNDGSLVKNQYRIINETGYTNNKKVGYFNISTDNKYLFLDGKDAKKNYTNLYKFGRFGQLNKLDNNGLYEVSLNPVQRLDVYNYVVPVDFCMILAFEDNLNVRRMQMKRNQLYNNYDCMSVLVNEDREYFEGAPGAFPEIICTNSNNNITNNEYNRYYVYGLGAMNFLLFVIAVALILTLFDKKQ
jgi:hypothetical protein